MKSKKILLLIVITLSLSGCFWDKKEVANPALEVKRSGDYFVREKEFSNDFFKAIVFSNEGNTERAISEIKKIQEEWNYIVLDFQDKRPEEFRKLSDWHGALNSINEEIKKAAEFSATGKLSESAQVMEKVHIQLVELHQKTGLKNREDVLSDYYLEMKKIIMSDNREEALKKMADLKMKFTELKEMYGGDAEMLKDLDNIAMAMSRIDNSTNKLFNEFKQDLKPAFLEAFIK